MKIFSKKNLFAFTRLKLDIIASIFVFFILFSFSYVVYNLLTQDLIYQISPVFKNTEIASFVNADTLFNDFKNQTLFLLIVSDIIIFIISLIFFDRMVKKMLQPIEYLSKIQEKFASNISHELRTPLSIMNMRGEILLSKIEKEEEREKSTESETFISETKNGVNVILKEIDSITGLIDDLLFEARIKYSENKIEHINIDTLEKILNKIYDHQKSLKEENVIFSVILEDIINTHFVKANPIHFERIFNNLLSNSFKFTNMGEVKVIFSKYKYKKNNYLKLSFIDTGIGINKSEISKVGDRFYRGKQIENEISGTGIGLSIVKDIVKDNNWNLKIKSEEGFGTEIIIDKISLY